MHRQRVRAGVGPRLAGARRAELAAVGKQLDAGLLGVLDQRVRQVAGQQRGDPAGLGGHGLDQGLARRAGSSTGTVPSTAHRPCSSSTAATNLPGSTLIWPIRPEREIARAAARSAEEYDASSTARTQALAHQRLARAAPRRAGVRGWTTVVVTASRPALAPGVLAAQGDQVAQLVVVELGERGLARRRAPRRRARACARSSWATRSSIVPWVISRCTWTGRVWPMR